MPEFWNKSQQRGRQTVAFWRRFLPDMAVGGITPDAHQADIDRLKPFAEAVAQARAVVKTCKRSELAAFARIRQLNLAIPRIITGQLADGHPARAALAAVYAVVPRSDALNLRRARLLLPVWGQADGALLARPQGGAVVRDGTGVADFARLVEAYPQVLQATADAVTAFRQTRTTLREQHRKVDRLNKRAYKKFQSEAFWNVALATALHSSITREKTSGSRKPRSKATRRSTLAALPAK